MLAGYHTEGIDIADHDQLASLATEAGLDGDEVADVLTSDAYADAVRDDEATARQLGISGVPFFVFDRTHGLSGAQPATVLRRALDQVHAATAEPVAAGARDHHDPHDHASGETCADGACSV